MLSIPSSQVQARLQGEKAYQLGQMFANAPEEEVRELLRSRGQPGDVITTPYTNLHVQVDGRSVLIDTGAGSLAPTTGRLPESLSAAGIDSEAVDTVVLTHAHPDHVVHRGEAWAWRPVETS